MRRAVIPLAATCLAMAAADMQTQPAMMNVYRNDGCFYRINLADGTTVRHVLSESDSVLLAVAPDGHGLEIPLRTIDSCAFRTMDVPRLRLSLDDYPEVTQLWDKELYLASTITVCGNGYSDDLDETALKIKGRGNSTWRYPKKPIRLKFAKKTSLCGLRKAKSYVLLANYIDASLMKNAVAMYIARELGMPWTSDIVPCDVELNGHPLGSYTLTHKIGINSGSVDIDETRGILLELSTEFDEEFRFRSPVYDLPVMVKDPDFTELYADHPDGPTPDERFKAWRDDFSEAEAAVAGGKGFEAFDLDSFVNYYLVCDITANHEVGWPKSLYLYKNNIGAGEPYCFGPVWDFDFSMNSLVPDGDGGFSERSATDALWLNPLFSELADCPEFKAAYRMRLDHFIENIYPGLVKFMDDYAADIEPSAKVNGLLWPDADADWTYARSSFDTVACVNALKAWLKSRIEYLEHTVSIQ